MLFLRGRMENDRMKHVVCSACDMKLYGFIYHTFGWHEQIAICHFCYNARKDYDD